MRLTFCEFSLVISRPLIVGAGTSPISRSGEKKYIKAKAFHKFIANLIADLSRKVWTESRRSFMPELSMLCESDRRASAAWPPVTLGVATSSVWDSTSDAERFHQSFCAA